MERGFPQEVIDQVRNSADIVEIIGRYVSLTQAGRRYKGLCPFHPEKTPSFTVNPELRIFKCFGCGEGGSVFSFLMKHAGMTFPEAVREAARSAGVSLPRFESSPQAKKKMAAREELSRIMAQAEKYFIERFRAASGRAAREYLKGREIPEETAQKYGLGWAEDRWDGLLKYFRRKGVSAEKLEKAGLVTARKESDGHYDRFRGRLIFPIRDQQGRVVAFGGRGLDSETIPKYLNSPETELFSKGRVVYGLSEAQRAIRGKKRVVVVEGYFDALALAARGLEEAVATMGTAMTGDQVRALRGYDLDVILVYDGDEAGLKAAIRAREVFSREKVGARILALPEGLDPDDFVKEYGLEAFEEALAKAQPMVKFVIDRLLDRPLKTPEQKAEAVRSLAPVLGGIESPVEQAAYVKEVAVTVGIDESAVLGGLTRDHFGRRPEPQRLARKITRARPTGPDRRFLAALINDPGCRDSLFGAGLLDIMEDEACLLVAETAAELFLHGDEFEAAELIDRLDPDSAELISELVWETPPEELREFRRELFEAVARHKRLSSEKELRTRIEAAQASGDEMEVIRLLAEMDNIATGDRAAR